MEKFFEEILSVNNLTVGEIVKNYKKLCSLLSQPVYSGKQKQLQLDNFKRYFDFEKIGVKYLITDIYDTPLPKGVRMSAIYTKYIEVLLLQRLSKEKGNELLITSPRLWTQLGMVNDKFLSMQDQKDLLLDIDKDMTKFEIDDFYKRCRQKLSKIISDSLDSLQKRFLIIWEKKRMIIKDGDHILVNSNEMEENILKVNHEILHSLGLENESQIYLRNLHKDFFRLRNLKMQELYQIDGVYECYKIIYNQENVIEALPEDKIKLQKMLLNDEIIKSVDTQAEQRYEKKGENSETVYELRLNGKSPKFCYPELYVPMQKKLSDELLKIKGEE